MMSDSNSVEVAEEVKAGQQQNWLFQAINELFAEDPSHVHTLPSGRVVAIQTSKVKTLREITALVQQYLNQFSPEEIISIVSMTSAAQEQIVNNGGDPFKEALSKIKSFTGGAQMIAKITHAGLEIAPKLVAMFTDLTAEEYDELPLEEGAIIAYSIFGRNYHFFSQQVRPAIAVCIGLRARSQQKKNEKPA